MAKIDKVIDAWLEAKGTILWLNWDVTDTEERAEAVKFWKKETEDFETFFLENYNKLS